LKSEANASHSITTRLSAPYLKRFAGTVASSVKAGVPPKGWVVGMAGVGAGAVVLMYTSSTVVHADSALSSVDQIAKNIEARIKFS
jgi:hypothetical protein